MYGIFTYIWLKFMVNVGKYTIHGCLCGIYIYIHPHPHRFKAFPCPALKAGLGEAHEIELQPVGTRHPQVGLPSISPPDVFMGT